MNEQDFLDNYLWPSGNKLDQTFTHALPAIEGLKKSGDFIVQCEYEDTFSTNIMTKYLSDTLGVRFVDVSKNSQNKVTGVFVRLVGTMSLVKPGYPFLVLDAPITNVSLRLAADVEFIKIEDIATTVFVLLPQADPAQRELFSATFSELVNEAGIAYTERDVTELSDLWGTLRVVEAKGINLDIIQKVRDISWNSYKRVIEQTQEKANFDYRPFQEHMIFDTAKREHLSFVRKGLSVPVEAQAAFFSVMVSGV